MEQKTNSLEMFYKKTVVPKLRAKFGFKNMYDIPRVTKCVINMGVGQASEDVKILEEAAKDMALIAGQRPMLTRAKKSISNFKIRKDQPIGCYVTLRRRIMYEFLERLIKVALPRIRDFRGLNAKSFDRHGNYTFGIREQNIFPEVVSDRVTRIQGMDITLATSAKNREQGLYLLYSLGIPFRDRDDRLVIKD